MLGIGPLRATIEKLIHAFNVENTFILLGQKTNPYPYIKHCDYFCLTSYYEGLPIVLAEAKLLNKYIIATNSASNGILDDYENKLIVENTENSIYEGFKKLMQNKIINDGNYLYDNSNILR